MADPHTIDRWMRGRMHALSRPVARAAGRDRDVTGCGKIRLLQLHQSLFSCQSDDRRKRQILPLIIIRCAGQYVEAGMLGRNGVIGSGAALDGPDTGVMIDKELLKGLASRSSALRMALVHQERALSAQTQQVAACNALHELEERLSRWLLQSRDLLQSDTLPLTQEFLSQMLGVQRSRPHVRRQTHGSERVTRASSRSRGSPRSTRVNAREIHPPHTRRGRQHEPQSRVGRPILSSSCGCS